MQRSQAVIHLATLSELAQGSLKIVGHHRHVVVIGRRRALVFVERCESARGVGAPVIHVVSQEVAARPEFHHSHCQRVVGIHVGAAMIGCGHASAQLTGEKRIGLRPAGVGLRVGRRLPRP